MQHRLFRQEDTLTVVLMGRLSFTENEYFRGIVNTIARDGINRVVLDLAGVESVDSAGLGLLLIARDYVVSGRGQVTLANAHGQVERMLDLARFSDFFSIERKPQTEEIN